MNLNIKKHKEVLAWSMYDFANQPFTTLVVTFIFSKYFVGNLSADFALDPKEATDNAEVLWSLGVGFTAVLVAFLSPVLGALADSSGYRKLFLVSSSYICVIATLILYFFQPYQEFHLFGYQIHVLIPALLCFVIANIGFEFGSVFCNSYLSDFSTKKEVGRISGFAWGLGFVAGFISLLIALVLITNMEDEDHGQRLINVIVAVWFLVFSIPTFLFVKDGDKPKKLLYKNIKESFSAISTTFKSIRKYKSIVHFLFARLFYNDALITIFAFGSIYADKVLGFEIGEIIVLGLVLNVSAAVGAFLFGLLEDKIGVKKMLMITLWFLVFATALAFLAPKISSSEHMITDKALFWIAGVIIGFMQGPNQSGSRALMTRLTPDKKKNEFFGFYAFSGKATAFVGPILYASVNDYFGSTSGAGLVVVFALFFVGMILFSSLKIKEADMQL